MDKIFGINIDLNKNYLKNPKLYGLDNNISLNSGDTGFFYLDINQLYPYYWDGSVSIPFGGQDLRETASPIFASLNITGNISASNLSGNNTGDQDLSGLVPKTTKINGYSLTSNINLNNNDIGLGNVLNINTTTTANITDSSNKRFVTDSQINVINNQSGINTGDETQTSIFNKIGYVPYNSSNPNGYINSYVETDPIFINSPAYTITNQNISNWNSKQNALTGTGLVRSNNGSISYDLTSYLIHNENIILEGDIIGSGNTLINTTISNSGVIAGNYNNVTVNSKGIITSGTTVNYQNPILLTTIGESGNSTFDGITLNIPNYSIEGIGGQSQLNGYGFVKTSGTTVYYDNSQYSLSDHIHYQLYQPNGTNPFVYTDNGGNLHVDGNIIQSGSTYITHSEEIYTSSNNIYLREGAVSGLANGETSGVIVKLFDGVNDAMLVCDNTGTARIGIDNNLQPLATRIESPTDGYFAYWDSTYGRLDFRYLNKNDVNLNNVENITLSSWSGTTNITTLGIINNGTWNGNSINDNYISSSNNWNTAYNKNVISVSLVSSGLTLTYRDNTYINSSIPTWNQDTTGTSANSIKWNDYDFDTESGYTEGFDYLLGRTSSTNQARLITVDGVQNWLGLGDNAYSSVEFLPLSNINGTNGYVPIYTSSNTLSNSLIYCDGDNNVMIGSILNPTNNKLFVNGNIKSSAFITSGGTSSQFVKGDGTLDNDSYYLASNPNDYITLNSLSSVSSGLTYSNTTGIFSITNGYVIPTTLEESNWNLSYDKILNSINLTSNQLSLILNDSSNVFSSIPIWNQDTTGTSNSLKINNANDNNQYYLLFSSSYNNPSSGYTNPNILINPYNGILTGGGYSISGGTSSGFLKADGSIDYTSYTSSNGTVSSITAGSGLTGGTITTFGTISLANYFADTVSAYSSKTANYFLAAPNGSNGIPTFRGIASNDIPILNQDTTGTSGNSLKWNTYTLDTSTQYSNGFDYIFARTSSTAQGRLITVNGMQTWLGLGSNAYTSTAYLPSSNISGASGYISYFTGTNTLSDSLLYTDGANVMLGTTMNPNGNKFLVNGNIKASAFITTNGTSSQFVKGDGSLDNNAYISSTGSVTKQINSISGNTILDATHYRVVVTNGSTITLPDATTCTGREYNIIRSGNYNVAINTTSNQTISGDTNAILGSKWQSVVVTSDGSNWIRCS